MSAHIAYVITDLELGGVPLHLRKLAGEMRRRGFRATVVSLAPPGPVGRMLRDDGIDVQSCDGSGGWDVRVLPRLASIFRAIKPDIIHSLLFHANVASRWAARRSGIPTDRVLCEIQTVEVERNWHLWVDRFTFEGCRLTIGNSPSVIEHVHRKAGIPLENLRLVRGGIDPEPIVKATPIDRATIGLSNDDKMILWVGRLDPVKGLYLLIDAMSRIDRSLRVHLVPAGGGPMRSELEARAKRLALHDRVHFLGPRSNVASLLKTCDLFVFPSRTEGLPNALLEAMAAGCPIVTTDVPGCRDLIRHDDTGLLVPYGDTDAIAAAITSVIGNRDRAAEMGHRAARAAASEWHISQTFDAYASLYREALAM